MGEALNKFVEEARHLSETFDSHTVFSIGGWDISQYTLYMFFILALVLMVVLIGGRKLQLVPKNKFLNTVEYGYDFVNTSIGQDVIGEGFKKHIPFLCTLFFFILIANVVGLIPGAKATTGTISITWALAAISFVYFNFYGLKTLGVFGYIKSLAPQGVSFPMNVLVWVVELFSTFLRLITLAVRLFCNMFAGHVVMGSFAIMASMFMQPLLQQVSAAHAVGALPSLAWLAILILIYAIELVVGAIQAYVFTVLTAVYVSEAEEVAEEE